MLTLASVAEEKDETAFQDPAVEESFYATPENYATTPTGATCGILVGIPCG